MKLTLINILLTLVFGTTALAAQVDLREFQTSVKAQGNRDTCAYFAVSALIENAIKKQFGTEYDISEEYEIFRNKIVHSWRPEVEFGNTYDVLKNFAQESYFYQESQLPYQKSSPDFTQTLSPEQMGFYDLRQKKVSRVEFRTLKFKMLSQLWVQRPWSEHIVTELKQGRSVVVTVKVAIPHINDQEGLFVMSDEINQQCETGKISCGGHAILLVGYDDVKKVFIFKNSWGPKWGSQGFGLISFDHIDKYTDQPLTAYFDKLSSPLIRETLPASPNCCN